MLRRLFNGKATTSITAAAALIGGTALFSRILGLLRDRVLAGEFGAGAVLDTYYAAFRIPDLLFNLLVVGALSAGFIPVLSARLNPTEAVVPQAAWRLVNNLLHVMGGALGFAAAVLALLSVPLTRLLAPGFTAAQVDQAAALTRIMLWSPMLLGVSAVIGGVLQSKKMFFHFSLAPVVYNVGIIIGALFLVPRLGIHGLAWGVVLGAGFHLLIQLPAVVGLGFHYRWVFDPRDADLRQILALMGPRTLSLAVSQLNVVVSTMLASLLSVGSLAVFNFANNLQTLPVGIVGIAFAIAAFPTLAELAEQRPRFIATLSATVRQILFFILPASLLLILLRAQVVRVLYGSGQFDWEDTVLTMHTLAWFAVSLVAQATIPVLVRAFYAQRDTLTPFFVAVVAAGANVALAVTLYRPLGVAGLALAFSLASLLQLVFLALWLRRRLGGLDGARLLHATGTLTAAALVMGVVTQGIKYAVGHWSGTQTFVGVAVQGGLAAVGGLVTYLAVSLVLGAPEAWDFFEPLRRRVQPARVVEVVSDPPV